MELASLDILYQKSHQSAQRSNFKRWNDMGGDSLTVMKWTYKYIRIKWIQAISLAVLLLCRIGGALGSLIYAYIANHFGRKTLLLFNTIPVIASWLLICFAQDVVYLYVGRFLGGFFGAPILSVATIMLSEIANDKVRGFLTSSLFFSEYFGIWLAYLIGNFDLDSIAIFSAALLAVFFVLFFFFPESQLFLVKRKKFPQAERSVRFYKSLRESNDDDNKMVHLEIDKIKLILADARRQSIVTSDTSLKWTDFTTKAGRKATGIGIVLVMLCTLNGVFTYYTAEIFETTGSNMPSNMAAIITGAVPVIAVVIAMGLVDRVGRKPLMAVSGFGTALGLIILAIYMMLKSWDIPVDKMNWIPLASYGFANFTASLGMQTLTIPIISGKILETNAGSRPCCNCNGTTQITICLILFFFFQRWCRKKSETQWSPCAICYSK